LATIHHSEEIMFTSTSNAVLAEAGAADVLIPLIRAAATISFAIVPCSLGFVIIAVSEQLIRSIMVGDDPELLVSDLQNQFPDHVIEVVEDDSAGPLAAAGERAYNTTSSAWGGVFAKMTPQQVEAIASKVLGEIRADRISV